MRSPASATPRISGKLTLLLAVACGASVANLYYAQPLLSTIAHTFGTGSATAGLVVTFSQVGYAAGLAFLVPVGDLVSRRSLVPGVLVATAAALVAAAVAQSMPWLMVAAALAGAGSVAAQILVPLAATLADDADRGRVVGTVMSGLLLGILLARSAAGLVAGAAGWRVVYWAAAALTLVVAAVLSRQLPREAPRARIDYRSLLASTAGLFAAEPVLRRRAALGGLGFAAFSVFWTTAAFMLSSPPYRYSDTVIGLFGLVGAAGALCATFAGRVADKGLSAVATVAFAVAVAVSFAPIAAGRSSLLALIAGIVVLDIGVQGLQVTNQSVIYRLAPDARSRVNSAYMVCYFAGGAAGSAVAGVVYGSGGWGAVSALGAGAGALAVGLGLWDLVRPASPASAT